MPQIFPGQSLTAEPKNAPYENPPQMIKPEEALLWHVERLAKPERVNALLDAIELDTTIVELTEGILRGAVMMGRHSIDVSLIIAPVLHEIIKSTAESADLDFDEGYPDETSEKNRVAYEISNHKARKMLKEYERKTGEELTDLEEGGLQAIQDEQGSLENKIEQKDQMETDLSSSNGLMSKPSLAVKKSVVEQEGIL